MLDGLTKNFTKTFITPFANFKFWKDLYNEIDQDQVFNNAASLSYYFLLAIFPGMIFLLAVLPYLPIENLSGEMMRLFSQVLPLSAADTLEKTITEVTTNKKQGLLSFGALFALWSASSGIYAIMQELNTTYDVRETRSFWKVRGLSIALTLVFGIAIIGSFALIVGGGLFQAFLEKSYYLNPVVPVLFQVFRWLVIFTLLTGGFAVIYYYGTNVDQKFKFITPGAFIGVVGLIVVSLLFRLYVSNFSNYSATYGSIGAIVVLMLWFYMAGSVILIGSEINALIENSPTKRDSIKENERLKSENRPEKPSPSERREVSAATASKPKSGSDPTPAGVHS
jgi:membrane protein